MGIALPAPMPAWIEADAKERYTGPALLLGYSETTTRGVSHGDLLAIGDDGKLCLVRSHEVTVDWRYNWKNHEWVEVSGIAEDSPSDDGGEDVSESVPDVDGGGGGNPIDSEGGSSTGSAGDMDSGEEE